MNEFDLRDGIIKCMKDYQKVLVDNVVKIGKKVSKKGKEELKQTTPNGNSTEKKMKDGWVSNTVINGDNITFVVRNKNKPHVVHLVENGHINKDGTKTKGKKFVKPIKESMEKEFIDELRKVVENGT